MSGFLEAILPGVLVEEHEEKCGGATPPLELCLTEMRERADRMAASCPFKRGDAVTVRPGTDLKGAGQPHVVMEILPKPVVDQSAEASWNRYLSTYTMRVAHYAGDTMVIHAVDHSAFEAWTDEHASAWRKREAQPRRKISVRPTVETSLQDVVRLLRTESRRYAAARITWSKGDLVEIVGHEVSRAVPPMAFEGRAIGLVETIDKSDETTRVVYFDESGDRRMQWFKSIDLKGYVALEAVPQTDAMT